MHKKKIGYSRMYMVTPSIWELVKKCVNEHEKKILDNLNNESSTFHDPTKSDIPTSSIIHNISRKDITPLEPSLSSTLDLSKPSNPQAPEDEVNYEPSVTSFHRSQDRSRSILDPNISHSSSRVNVSKIPLPNDSFDESSFNPINMSQHSNKSKINLSQPTFNLSDSFGRLPQNFPSESSLHNIDSYDNFNPRGTSTPIDRSLILPDPNPVPVPIPIQTLAACKKKLPRSPVKTRIKTGVLPAANPTSNGNTCGYCGKHFARKWNLKKHIITVHQQKITPDPDQPAITSLKRKQQPDFVQPSFKTARTETFDRWNIN